MTAIACQVVQRMSVEYLGENIGFISNTTLEYIKEKCNKSLSGDKVDKIDENYNNIENSITITDEKLLIKLLKEINTLSKNTKVNAQKVEENTKAICILNKEINNPNDKWRERMVIYNRCVGYCCSTIYY